MVRAWLPRSFSTSESGQGRKVWAQEVHGEPPLTELLADPIVHLVMRRDGVTPETLRTVIDEARSSLVLD